ncbi:hypothetical protein [Methanohalophilus sp.]
MMRKEIDSLIKFRSLANEHDFKRARQIIEKGEFWCSKLWNHNDPMEGIFFTYNYDSIDSLFDGKNNYVICSFALPEALSEPLLWGYYANGFKGIAIEIEPNDNETFREIQYYKESDFREKIFESTDEIPDIITRKLDNWKHEKEVRLIKKSIKESNYNIGSIKKVHFGSPYQNASNYQQIHDNSRTLRKYEDLKNNLKLICEDKGIETLDYVHQN